MTNIYKNGWQSNSFMCAVLPIQLSTELHIFLNKKYLLSFNLEIYVYSIKQFRLHFTQQIPWHLDILISTITQSRSLTISKCFFANLNSCWVKRYVLILVGAHKDNIFEPS